LSVGDKVELKVLKVNRDRIELASANIWFLY
jgi:sRNA-binding carbon storage regulator CsrA